MGILRQGDKAMKYTVKKIFSILLILAGLFSIYAAVAGLKDCQDIKAYKELDGKEAQRVSELEDAIYQLKDNEKSYLKGLTDYAGGEVELGEGQEKLTSGQKAYDEGVKQLEAGKAAYNAGLKKLQENTDAYNAGKEKLAQIEPLLPYIDQYIKLRQSTLNAIEETIGTIGESLGLGNISTKQTFDVAQAYLADTIRPLAQELGIDIPANVTDIPAYIQRMVAEGEAQIAEYETGLVQLEAAKKEIEAGEAKLAKAKQELEKGYEDYEDGVEQLSSGKKQLDTFEDGMKQVNEYTELFFTQETVYRNNGDVAVPNVMDRLGADFSWLMMGNNGKAVRMMNGEPYLDLDQCLLVCDYFHDFYEEQVADVTHELEGRMYLYFVMLGVGALAIVAGIIGLIGNKGMILGVITAVAAIAANIYGMIGGYTGYTYLVRDVGADGEYLVNAAGEYTYTYSGTLQLIALIAVAVVAIVFAVVAIVTKKKSTDVLLPESAEAEEF